MTLLSCQNTSSHILFLCGYSPAIAPRLPPCPSLLCSRPRPPLVNPACTTVSPGSSRRLKSPSQLRPERISPSLELRRKRCQDNGRNAIRFCPCCRDVRLHLNHPDRSLRRHHRRHGPDRRSFRLIPYPSGLYFVLGGKIAQRIVR